MVQLFIIALGIFVRIFDPHEYLVTLFNFRQDAGEASPGTFGNALMHHKTTYYVAGLLLFVALLAILAIIVICVGSTGEALGPCCDPSDCCDGSPGCSCIVMIIVVVLAAVVVGIFAGLIALVLSIQSMVQRCAQLRELSALTREYVVEDLANPDDLGENDPCEVGTFEIADPTQQAALQRQIANEIDGLFSGSFRPGSVRGRVRSAPTENGSMGSTP